MLLLCSLLPRLLIAAVPLAPSGLAGPKISGLWSPLQLPMDWSSPLTLLLVMLVLLVVSAPGPADAVVRPLAAAASWGVAVFALDFNAYLPNHGHRPGHVQKGSGPLL